MHKSIATLVIAGTLLLTLGHPAASQFSAWCGNACSSTDGGVDNIDCDWQPGSPGQSCQAKMLCTAAECTAWATAKAPTIDALQITPAQAKAITGAVTFKGSRPPRR